MDIKREVGEIEASLKTKIKLYKERAREIEQYLSKKPGEWGRFQSEFNRELNQIFNDIMRFEKNNLMKNNNVKPNKLKRLFIKNIRKLFIRGTYIPWGTLKPYGYAGDFKIVDDIYQNNPLTEGYARLFDNYFQTSAISIGVRNRKEDFKRFLYDFIEERKRNSNIWIMNLGCGPCREIEELFRAGVLEKKSIYFDCYDNDERALNYAKNLLSGYDKINFIKLDILNIIRNKKFIDKKYDFIYAAGFYDYFNNKVATALNKRLKGLLTRNGILVLSAVRDKYSNPSVHFMEWIGDWDLFYRNENEFKEVFLAAGFKEEQIKVQYEQQGIMQYIIAKN